MDNKTAQTLFKMLLKDYQRQGKINNQDLALPGADLATKVSETIKRRKRNYSHSFPIIVTMHLIKQTTTILNNNSNT